MADPIRRHGPMTSIRTLNHGRRYYAELLHLIRTDRDLVAAMWDDAESTPDEIDIPGTTWVVVLTDLGEPAAWCAARVVDGVLKCHSNFEVPAHRGLGLYELAYRQRHRDVVLRSDKPAVTYLFAGPIDLHRADGWLLTGNDGPGQILGHQWWELRRDTLDPRTYAYVNAQHAAGDAERDLFREIEPRPEPGTTAVGILHRALRQL